MDDKKTPLLIIGDGHEARQILDIALALDILVYGFIAREELDKPREVNDVLVVAGLGSKDSDSLLDDEHVKVVFAESDPEKRRELIKRTRGLKAELSNLIHPGTSVSEYSKLGMGNVMAAGVSIGANSFVGSFNQLENGVLLGPDCIVGDYCTLQAGVKIGREVEIGNEVFISIGAVIHHNVKIGNGARIGAGAVVIQDVPEDASVFGNPAQVLDS